MSEGKEEQYRRTGLWMAAIGLLTAFIAGPLFYSQVSKVLGLLLPLFGFGLAAGGLWLHNIRGKGRDERQLEIERRASYLALMTFSVLTTALIWINIYAGNIFKNFFQPPELILAPLANFTWLAWSLAYLYYSRTM